MFASHARVYDYGGKDLDHMTSQDLSRRRRFAILAGLFLFALAIRLVGLDFGYLLGDERVNFAAKVLAGQVVPDQHFYPPLFNYLGAVALVVLYGVGEVVGWWSGLAGFRDQYFDDPTVFYLALRVMTSLFAAAIAPLFYLVARCMGFEPRRAFIVGLFGAVTPITVYLSHIAKSDVPLAMSMVLCVWLLLRRLQDGPRRDFWLGAGLILGVSFKQSFVFFAFPLLMMHLFHVVRDEGWVSWGRSVLRMLLVGMPLWAVCNIGIILDLANFVTYQKIQTVMSVRVGEGMGESLVLWFTMLSDNVIGITWVMAAAFLGFPVLWALRPGSAPRYLPQLWLVAFVAVALVVWIARLRQPEGLWIGFFTVVQLVVALGLVALLRDRLRIVGVIACVAAFSLSGLGMATIWRQSLAPAMMPDVAGYVANTYAGARIFSGVDLGLPVAAEARVEEQDRISRLAAKYDVTLPEQAAPDHAAPEDGLFIRQAPSVMFGLEAASDADLRGIVQPHAWPLQPEEWVLRDWRKSGFEVFVVSNLAYLVNETPSPVFRAFYGELAASCAIARVFPAAKPLYLERDITVLTCPPI
ncbi:ArnT family glycosyltransferase [Shimia biformata]|uniref:ArnT family glycosyltransferase n=1 Tax=Shimia biformata TaxID=1294299 RepID=UPI00194FA1D3|nr:glycosyltransferase family 39 protein [Shimia biformata]